MGSVAVRSVALGCGAYLPDRVVTNEELSRLVETSDAWIVERTGIRERRLAADDETTSDLAVRAADAALAAAGVSAADLDLIVVATATPDHTFPATATQVQAALGADRAFAYDLQAVCSGFVYALGVVDGQIRAGQVETALVIGAETFSRILDWNDRSTCVLFGDGAGAVVLRADESGSAQAPRGVLSVDLNSDGRLKDLLYVDGGPSVSGTVGHLRMQGRDVFRQAVKNLSATARVVLDRAGVSAEQVDWVVPHQANIRIIEATAKKLDIPMDKVVVTIERHGNTSAASIPLALCEAVGDGRIKPGDLVLMEAMGGGMTWGAALLRW